MPTHTTSSLLYVQTSYGSFPTEEVWDFIMHLLTLYAQRNCKTMPELSSSPLGIPTTRQHLPRPAQRG